MGGYHIGSFKPLFRGAAMPCLQPRGRAARKSWRRRAAVLALGLASLGASALGASAAHPAGFDARSFGGMRFRNVGPYRGGRVCAVTGVRGRPATFYFGSTGGGVWKTDDAGTTLDPISDRDFSTGSGRAIPRAPFDPHRNYLSRRQPQPPRHP